VISFSALLKPITTGQYNQKLFLFNLPPFITDGNAKVMIQLLGDAFFLKLLQFS